MKQEKILGSMADAKGRSERRASRVRAYIQAFAVATSIATGAMAGDAPRGCEGDDVLYRSFAQVWIGMKPYAPDGLDRVSDQELLTRVCSLDPDGRLRLAQRAMAERSRPARECLSKIDASLPLAAVSDVAKACWALIK